MTIYRNNYDTNSKGKSIKTVCFYDSGTARFLFDEAFETLETAGRGFTKYYYVDSGNLPNSDSVSFTIKGEREAKIKFLEDVGVDVTPNDDGGIDGDVIRALSETPSVANYTKLNDNDLRDYKLELVPSKSITWVKVHGYCQGDYAEIAYCPDDAETAYGNAPEYNALKHEFSRLLYDQPIYAVVTVDGNECDYGEYGLDQYEWQREDFAEAVAKETGADKDEILALLPKDLEHT